MVKSMDISVGKVMESLKKHNLSENTLIVFTSDNGGLTQRYGKHDDFTENLPLRRGKGSAFEGGVRVPAIAWWPKEIAAAKVCDTPIISVDYYPTFLTLAGGTAVLDGIENLDGKNLLGLFEKQHISLERDLFWHYPHYHAGGDWPYSSIRSGSYRLIESLEDGHLELYHLTEDIGEEKDLSKSMPEKTKEMKSRLVRWRRKVGAQMPTLNPAFDPARATQVAKKKRGSKLQNKAAEER
jgi:arylsulfatase A-like enzyme